MPSGAQDQLEPRTGHAVRAQDQLEPRSGHALRLLLPRDIVPIGPLLAPRTGHVPKDRTARVDMPSGAPEQLEPRTGHALGPLPPLNISPICPLPGTQNWTCPACPDHARPARLNHFGGRLPQGAGRRLMGLVRCRETSSVERSGEPLLQGISLFMHLVTHMTDLSRDIFGDFPWVVF